MRIVAAHFEDYDNADEGQRETIQRFISDLIRERDQEGRYVATDQLLNAICLIRAGLDLEEDIDPEKCKQRLREYVLNPIDLTPER